MATEPRARRSQGIHGVGEGVHKLAKGLGDNPLKKMHEGQRVDNGFGGVYFRTSTPTDPSNSQNTLTNTGFI